MAEHNVTSTTSRYTKPKALLFDVFGTVVDWRTTVAGYLQRQSHDSLNSGPSSSISPAVRAKCSIIDWHIFAQEWRKSYYGFTRDQNRRKDNNESLAPMTVDDHHLESLRALLDQHGISGLWTDDEVFQVSQIWHRLAPHPDSTPGLTALNHQSLITATLSNANLSLLADMASPTNANLPWTHIWGAEHWGAYKPHPSVYSSACRELRLDPGECAMVAAHLEDLEAARKCGMRTVYVERVGEEAWSRERVDEARRQGWVDVWVGVGDDSMGGGILQVAKILEGWANQ